MMNKSWSARLCILFHTSYTFAKWFLLKFHCHPHPDEVCVNFVVMFQKHMRPTGISEKGMREMISCLKNSPDVLTVIPFET